MHGFESEVRGSDIPIDCNLNLRTYNCSDCGLSIDRDLKVSINLTNKVAKTVNAFG